MRIFFLFTFLLFSGAAYGAPKTETAIFAGGCFWSMEAAFEGVEGVASVISGYTGGTVKDPSYEQVSMGATGHVEAVKIAYDPQKISYGELLKIYWYNVDPFNASGQFCDSGPEYRAEIFTTSKAQEKAAADSKTRVAEQLGQTPVTQILPAGKFYPAEEYHQDYKNKNPIQYGLYRAGCGRDRTTAKIWGDKRPI
jgi:peptide-methionine (S)-S-oxide reductase